MLTKRYVEGQGIVVIEKRKTRFRVEPVPRDPDAANEVSHQDYLLVIALEVSYKSLPTTAKHTLAGRTS